MWRARQPFVDEEPFAVLSGKQPYKTVSECPNVQSENLCNLILGSAL